MVLPADLFYSLTRCSSATRLWEFSQFWEFQLLCWDKIQICWEFPKPVKVWEFCTWGIDCVIMVFFCRVSGIFNHIQTYAIANAQPVGQLVENLLYICLFYHTDSSMKCLHGAEKFQLSLVREVLSWQLGCALALPGQWVGGRWEIKTCRNFFPSSCSQRLFQPSWVINSFG